MVLLIGILLAVTVAWRVRHLGLYIPLCDALGVILSGVAALAYTGHVVALVPIEHPLKGSIGMLCVFLIGWMMFRTVAHSFPGDWAVDFPHTVNKFGGMAVAFGGTMMFVGMVSVLLLTTGDLLLSKAAWLEAPLHQTAGIAVSICQFVAALAGSDQPVTLETVTKLHGLV